MALRPLALGRSGTLPGVSFVMPVLNEVTHVRAAVESLLEQEYDGPMEVALALGPSMDGTTELIADMSAKDPRIRMVDNPVGSTPAGLNLAIQASQYPIVIRVDAHSVLPADYTHVAVETMMRTDADNVGGVMDARGISPFEQAVARAYGSKVGLGGTRLHLGGQEGPAETVYLGVFNRESILSLGLFDENIKRGQDWELNRRIRDAGGTVWFTPALHVVYRPRSSMRTLARQMFSTGLWRGELSRRFFKASGLRYFIPPLMVLGSILGTILGLIGLGMAVSGAPSILLYGWVIPGLYVAFVLIGTLLSTRGMPVAAKLWFLVVLPCIHIAWGLGFVLGFARLTSNIAAHNGR